MLAVWGDEGSRLKATEAMVCQYPSYGYSLIHAMLVAEGFKVGRDRFYRHWRTHGYGVR